MQAAFPNTGARVMLFAGGPATDGPGLVVGPELREPIRSHHDIDRDSVKHFKRATKVSLRWHDQVTVADAVQFYESLSKRASVNGHAIDVYAGCLDQVGLLEMKSLTNATNGFMIISDSFMTAIFKQTFLRTLSKDEQDYLKMGFNGTFEVLVSYFFPVGVPAHAS